MALGDLLHRWPLLASAALVAAQTAPDPAPPPATPRQQAPTIEVRADPRVELMSLLFRLAGNPQYNQSTSFPYTRAADRRFAEFKSHPAVELARRLRRQDGIGYDAVMRLALHVEDVESLDERIAFDTKPPGLVPRWQVDHARELLEAARDFVDVTHFADFCDEQAPLHAQAAERLRATLGKRDFLAWLEKFFGERPRARFFAEPGLLNGGANYSVTITFPTGEQEIHVVLGAESADAQGIPRFDESVFPTAAHEFCHAFVNPVVDRHFDRLGRSGEQLLQWTRRAMEGQAYGDGRTVLCESLVRASVVRFMAQTSGPDAAEREIGDQVRRRFLWTRELADLLAVYEGSRERAPTLDAFAEELGAFFDDQARADSPRALWIGPVDAMLRDFRQRMVVVAPPAAADGAAQQLGDYVQQVHARFYAKDSIPLVHADELADPAKEAVLADQALVLYGTAAGNALVKRVLESARISWSDEALTVGGREFRGSNLVLIACLQSPWNRALPVILYAARADADLLEANSFRHGGFDVLIGEWDARHRPVVRYESNFERRADGRWLLGDVAR